MTTETKDAPDKLDIARDLLRRTSLALPGWTAPAARLTAAQRAAIQQTNRTNAEALHRILSDHGWPGVTLVGADAAQAAWLIALHADDAEFQRTALAAMADAVSQGEAEPRQWAHLYDRCCALAGVKQLYGTQFVYGPDGVEPYPIAEPETLDERRTQLGLKSHAETARIIQDHHGGEAA